MLHFEEPKPHTEYSAKGVAAHSVLRCVQYDNRVVYPFVCGALSRTADCKLGGVNHDVSEAVIVNLIRDLTGDKVRVAAVDLFARQGLCRVWFQNGRHDFPLVKETMHELVWMGPLRQHCAVVARRVDGSHDTLAQFLRENAQQPGLVPCPTRTMTVEEWEER